MILGLTVLRFALLFSFVSGPITLTVLWALGWSMVALAILVHLPVRVLAVFTVSMIALHNLADSVSASQLGAAGWVWNILHQLGTFQVGGMVVLVAYPLVPWIAVMAAGFCFGHIMALDPPQRREWIVRIGLSQAGTAPGGSAVKLISGHGTACNP